MVAQVNGQEISVHQVNQLLQAQPPATAASAVDRAAQRALDRLIEQELAVQQALDQELDRDPTVMQALTAARREVLARAWVDRVAAGVPAASATELRTAYDAQPALFAQRQVFELQELLVPVTVAQFESLKQVLQRARKVDEVTQHLREQRLPLQATRLTQSAEGLPPALLQRLLLMRDGQAVLLGAPGAARIVVRVAARPDPLAFEAARPLLERQLLLQRQGEAVRTGIELAASRSRIERLGPFAMAASGAAAAGPSISRPDDAPRAAADSGASDPFSRRSTPPSLLPPPLLAGSAPPESAAQAPRPAASAVDADSVRRGMAGLR